ncbi:hypothetical protein KEJ21_05700, partial [Candidatus Bathyarchaeota archaeon]|nr:hypothetical protein [Candidatus Bathyarchaeota archaeon]
MNKECLELSPWQLQTGLEWFLSNGFLEKKMKGLYAITFRGEELLKLVDEVPMTGFNKPGTCEKSRCQA